MKISRRQHKQLQEISEPLNDLIKSILDAPDDKLPQLLNSNLSWEAPRGSLLNWITVLNKFDDILENVTTKYHLTEDYTKPIEFDPKTTELVLSVLKFTHMLLDKCNFKTVYASSHRLYDLLNSPTVPVIIAVLEIFVILARRFSIRSMRTTFISQRKVSDRLYPMSLFLPAATITSNTGTDENHSLIDFIKDNIQAPQKWKRIEFFYYPDEKTLTTENQASGIENSPSIKRVKNQRQHQQQQSESPIKRKKGSQENEEKIESTPSSRSQRLFISEEDVRKLSLQQLYDKGSEKLPSRYWLRFSLKALMAKAFNSNSYDSIKLRQDLVVIKSLTTAILVAVRSQFEVSSRIFEADPTLFSSFIDLINLQNPVPSHVRIAAAKVLECIASLKTWSGEILRGLSGSVSHGLLFQNLRLLTKQLKNGNKDEINEDFNTLYIATLASIVGTKGLQTVVVSAGLVQQLTQFLALRSEYKTTLGAAVHLLDITVSPVPDNVALFRENNGFNALIEAVGYEIDFALENPGALGPPPSLVKVRYSLPYKQAQYITTLLSFVNHLILRESGDSVRNLFDSPILKSLNKILVNIPTFGYSILTMCLNIVSAIIHNEPTSYPILKEAGTVDLILTRFNSFLGNAPTLITALPNIIGALALNNEGLQKIQEHKIIPEFFKIFDDDSIAKVLVIDEVSETLSAAFDELARHYSELKPIIIQEIVNLVKRLPEIGTKDLPPTEIYTSDKGWFYHSRDEEIIDEEEGAGKIVTWESLESAYTLENASVFLGSLIQYSNSWTVVIESLPAAYWIPLLCLHNSPFDYVYSNSMYPLNGVLKQFDVLKHSDDDKRGYGFAVVLAQAFTCVSKVSDFATSTEKVSLFQKLEGNIVASNDLLQRLIDVNNILFALTDVYCNPTSLSTIRVEQLASLFSTDDGLETLKMLTKLLERVIYEEYVLRTTMPDTVADETCSNNNEDGFPPLKIAAKISNEDNTHEKTSAKFKNAVQIRFTLQRIHTSISIILNSLLTLSTITRTDLTVDLYRGPIVRICDTITQNFVSLLESPLTAVDACLLIKLHTMHYCLIDHSSGKVLTIAGILYMQHDGFIKEVEILKKYWNILTIQDNKTSPDPNQPKVITDKPEDIVNNVVLRILRFFNRANDYDRLSTVPHGPLFYEGDYTGSINVQGNVLRASLATQTKIVTFAALSVIFEEESFTSLNEDSNLETDIAENIVIMASHAFNTTGAGGEIARSDGTLFQLDWKQARISENRIEYLITLGLTRDEAIKILTDTGGDLSNLEDEDFHPQGVSPEKWTDVREKAKAVRYTVPQPDLIAPQFENYHTLDDLDELRFMKSEFFIDQVLYLVQLCPKTLQHVAEFFLNTFLKQRKSDIAGFEDSILQTILEFILSFDIPDSDSKQLGSMLGLFGKLVYDEAVFYGCHSSLELYSSEIINTIKPSQVNYDWFSHALLGLEKLVLAYRVPVDETSLDNQAYIPNSNHAPVPLKISKTLYDKLFDVLLAVDELTNTQSAVAIAWILSLYACEYEYAQRIIKSGLIHKISGVFKNLKPNSEERPALQSAFAELSRRCYETNNVLHDLILRSIRKCFSSKKKDGSYDKKLDLNTALLELHPAIMRSPDIFVEEFSKRVRLIDFKEPLLSLAVSYFEVKDEDVSMADANNAEANSKESNVSSKISSQTGVMHTLLTELMATVKKDWISDPPLTEEEKKKKAEDEKNELSKPEKIDTYKNENFGYIVYLLKVMTELLSSYKESKLEFLTFSKKQLFQDNDESPKPRSTSLNFILHQLALSVATGKPDVPESEKERRRVVSERAFKLVAAFVSTIDSKDLLADAKVVDPDLTFIRKFTIDTIHKAVKNVFTSTSGGLAARYSKIVALNEVVFELISSGKNALIDQSSTKYDEYHMAKVILESSLPASLSNILSEVDMNFGEHFYVLESIVRVMSGLAKIKAAHQDLFRTNELNNGADEEEVEEDENDFKEETPDLFQNSTLGMYDIGEVDSEEDYSDEDIDFGDGQDEDMLDNGRDLEIVYSEDEDDFEEDDDEGDVIIGSDEGEEVFDEDENEDASDQSAGSIISDSESDMDDASQYDLEIISEDEDGDSGSEGETGDEEFFYDYDQDHEAHAEGDEDVNFSEYGDLDSELEEEAEHIMNQDSRSNRTSSSPGNGVVNIELDDQYLDAGVDYGDLDDDAMEDDEDDEEEDDSELESDAGSISFNPESLHRGMRVIARQHHTGHNHRHNHGHGHGHHGDGVEMSRSDALQSLYRNGWNVLQGNVNEMSAALQALVLNSNRQQLKRHTSEFLTRSTQERWADIYGKEWSVNSVAQRITREIYEPSKILAEEKAKEEEALRQKKEEEAKQRQQEEEEKKRIEQEEREAEAHNEQHEPNASNNGEGENNTALEPILVRIGGREVDIAGTDIDPEFFEALPDYMREEVFTQHISQRRASAAAAAATAESESAQNSREIDPDFLNALPNGIRNEILAQEALSTRLGGMIDSNDSAIESSSSNETPNDDANGDGSAKKKQKVYFTPLVDRYGVASLIRFVFVPQSFHGRRPLYELFSELCTNKQTRAEVLGYLMAILQYGISDQTSLEKIYFQIAASADSTQATSSGTDKVSTPKTPIAPLKSKQSSSADLFPHRTTPFVVATQVLEALQFLLESEPQLRFYFLTEHESIIQSKKVTSAKKLSSWKQSKYPLNALLGLLNYDVVRKKSILMDLLSRIIQITTRSLNVLEKVKAGKEGEVPKRKIELPHVLDSSLRNTVSILSSDDCSARTFQHTLSAMQNLVVVAHASDIFAVELSKMANDLDATLIKDLNKLTEDLSNNLEVKDFDGEILEKFTPQGSAQSKLLRVLTALDYLFGKQEQKDEAKKSENIKRLTNIYKDLDLGRLWGALSEALEIFEANKAITHLATVLLPIIEALMVVCKHSKIQARDVLKYESKKCDFANEPIESLFFSFTDIHKKILNHMVRSNPKLMSGPFAMLVKNPRVLEFDNKKNYFDRQLHKTEEDKPVLKFTIRRDQVFLDSYRALFFKPNEQFRDSKLDVTFKGEAGVDAGGVTREWYQVLSRQMFNPDYALFLPIASDKTTFHPNRTSWVNPEHLSFFKFIGRIIGKAIYDNCFLDCHFTRDVYKSILGRSVSLKDLETIDLEYYKSLMWMLENDITDVIIETFSVETDDYGEVKTIDLIPNGRDIAVTEENKQDYVRLIVEYRLQKSVKEQVDNFLIGFHEIIPKELISIFDEQELELLISGLPDIDVDDWKNNTTYVNYTQNSKEISYFWRAVRSFDTEERAKLLQFATGTSKVPLNGFKELGGSNGTSKFSIHKDFGSTDRLPSSHTCFNQIDLPAYDSYETLRGSLLLAITEGHEGFGLA